MSETVQSICVNNYNNYQTKRSKEIFNAVIDKGKTTKTDHLLTSLPRTSKQLRLFVTSTPFMHTLEKLESFLGYKLRNLDDQDLTSFFDRLSFRNFSNLQIVLFGRNVYKFTRRKRSTFYGEPKSEEPSRGANKLYWNLEERKEKWSKWSAIFQAPTDRLASREKFISKKNFVFRIKFVIIVVWMYKW